jgi:hypothetical protein
MEKEIIKKNFKLEWNNNKKDLKKIVKYYVDNYKKIKYNNIYYNIIKINTTTDDMPYTYKFYKMINNIPYETFLIKAYDWAFNNILRDFNIKKFIEIDEELVSVYNFMFSSRYVGFDIRLYIQNKINNCYKYNFDHMDLYFFDNKDVDNTTIEFIYKITKWIYDINPRHKIRLFIFNIPIKKDMDTKILTYENSCSAFTSLKYKEITIWRNDELYKIIIHELIHLLFLDIKFTWQNSNVYNLKYIPERLRTGVSINESVTEFIAMFFYTILSSIIKNKKFKSLYYRQIKHSWKMTSKLLNIFNIKNFSKDLIKFNQTNNIFAYVVLKTIYTINFTQIIFAFPYFRKYIDLDIIKCDTERCDKVIEYIYQVTKNLDIKFVNSVIKNLNTSKSFTYLLKL